MTRLERLKKAIAYLKGQEIIFKQKDIVEKMKINKSSLSSALSGNEKYLTDSFIMKFCSTFSIINEKWLLNEVGNISNDFNNKNMLFLEKGGVSFSVKEIALFVVENENEFMKIKAFSNMSELMARDRVIEIMEKKRVKLNKN